MSGAVFSTPFFSVDAVKDALARGNPDCVVRLRSTSGRFVSPLWQSSLQPTVVLDVSAELAAAGLAAAELAGGSEPVSAVNGLIVSILKRLGVGC